MVVAVPVLWLLMPWLMGLAYGADYREHATTAARLVLIAAALQFVWGWTKSFPVSIGRPGLRIVAHGGRDRGLRAAAARARRRVGRDRRAPRRWSSRRRSFCLLWIGAARAAAGRARVRTEALAS